ncbi:MAG: flavodoxin [Actinobacteria bacterium]|nr:flavodoxin [Actinomycetota bacterium]
MDIAVVYQSQTGSTKKVAEAILDELPQGTVLAPMDLCDSLVGYDFAFVGFPIHAFGPDEIAKGFLENVAAGHCIALFVTHASPESDSPPLQEWLKACRKAAAASDIVSMFDCQGELAEPIKQHMLASDDPQMRAWAESDDSRGQPDETRLQKAREWARQVMTTVGPH